MSWSVQYLGTPENINKAIDEQGTKLEGKSKEEFDEALPHIKALVSMNIQKESPYSLPLKVIASGHAYDGFSNLQLSIGYSDALLV